MKLDIKKIADECKRILCRIDNSDWKNRQITVRRNLSRERHFGIFIHRGAVNIICFISCAAILHLYRSWM